MADNYKIGAGITLDGEKEYKKAITAINKDMSVLSSELKKVTAQFDDNGDSIEALTAKQAVYNKRADEQRKKIDVITGALAGAKKEYGENSDQVKNWQIKLNNAEADLAKTEKSIRETSRQLDNMGGELDDSKTKLKATGEAAEDAGNKAQKSENDWDGLGNKLKTGVVAAAKVSAAAIAAVGAACIAAAKGAYELAKNSGEYADNLLTTATATGISAENLQKWDYAARFIDTDVDTMTGSMQKMVKQVGEVNNGSKTASANFKALGVAVYDSTGELRGTQDIFFDAIDALGKISNETERDALSMQIFGRSAQDLNPLIVAGSDALRNLGDEAEGMGLVLDDEALGSLGAFDDAMQRLDALVQGVGRSFILNFLPAIQGAVEGVSDVMGEFGKLLQDGLQPADITAAGEIVAEKLAEGMTALEKYLPTMLTAVSTVLTQLVGMVIGILPTLLPSLVTAATQLVLSLVGYIVDALPAITTAAIQAVVILANGISSALPALLPAAVSAITAVVQALVDNVDLIVDAAITLVMALADGLVAALPILLEQVPTLLLALTQAMMDNQDKVWDAAGKVMASMAVGLVKSIPQLIQVMPKLLTMLVTGLLNNIYIIVMMIPTIYKAVGQSLINMDWGKIGKDLISGIANGVSNAWGVVRDALKAAVDRAVSSFKRLFGIHSPSKYMADTLGINLGRGVAVGIDDSTDDVMDAMGGMQDAIMGTPLTTRVQSGISAAASTLSGKVAAAGAMQPVQLVLDGRTLAEVLLPMTSSMLNGQRVNLALARGIT